MNRQYQIQITPKALQDMESIYSYIAEELLVPETALRQYNQIAKAIMNLQYWPERNHFYPFSSSELQNVRCMNVEHYSVLYTVDHLSVTILRVLYGSSNIEKYFLE